MTGCRPHDLLLLAAAAVDTRAATAPPWVRAALREAPWVVVRRAGAPPGHVAVGVRGRARSQRFAWTVACDDIRAVRTPEDLADVVTPDRGMPALDAFAGTRDVLRSVGLPWGPTGSVGFELATGRPTVTTESDLDLIVRIPDPTTSAFDRLAQVHAALALLPVRADCQIELPSGGVSLTELVSGGTAVLARTSHGPSFIEVPRLLR